MINKLIQDKVANLVNEARVSLSDIKRVSIDKAWKILQLAIAHLVQIIEEIATDLSGPEKKKIALYHLNIFYDAVFVMVDIPFVPAILESIIHKYIKQILMVMVSSSIDATVQIFRETGIFLKRGNKNE